MKTVHDLQTKREIQNPDRFIHCKATMEPELAGEFEDKLHAEFAEQSGRQWRSQTFQKTVANTLKTP